jgi:hypothetical protein
MSERTRLTPSELGIIRDTWATQPGPVADLVRSLLGHIDALAPASVGGVDLERWRSLIARVDAYAKRQGLPSADDEHHCTILLSDARSVVAALERAARIEAAARVVADVACDEVPPAEVCPGCDWCPLRAAFGEEGGR